MDHNDSLWVDRRLESLEPPAAWQPDTDGAVRRFQKLRRDATTARRRRIWFVFAAAAACLAAAVIAPRLVHAPALSRGPLAPEVTSAVFHQTGSPSAPILAEVYSDYQCGYCAAFFTETVPHLMTDYVETGKLRLLHRDLPLPQHPYSRLAARYANAAGRIGRYEFAVDTIFRTQAEWSADGDIDSRLARALPAADMQRIRQLVRESPDLDASIDQDLQRARADEIRMTPTLIVTANGERHSLAPVPSYPLLKDYLDELLKTNCRENPNAARC